MTERLRLSHVQHSSDVTKTLLYKFWLRSLIDVESRPGGGFSRFPPLFLVKLCATPTSVQRETD